jgi:hypothetical protein
MSQARQPAGTPAGGRWSASTHSESDVVLGEDLDAAWAQVHEELVSWESDAARLAAEHEELEARGQELHGRVSDLARQRIDAGLTSARPGLRAVETADEAAGPAPDDGVVDGRDPLVQAGDVFDQVRVFDQEVGDTEGMVFHRRRDGVWPDWPYAMRFQADRPLSSAEIAHCAQLIGYTYRSEVRGESIGHPQQDSPYSFVIYADTTKTRSDDIGAALERFEGNLPDLLRDGSPVRSTDRSGPGTKGTRLVDGFGASAPTFELYYDSVGVDIDSPAADVRRDSPPA